MTLVREKGRGGKNPFSLADFPSDFIKFVQLNLLQDTPIDQSISFSV